MHIVILVYFALIVLFVAGIYTIFFYGKPYPFRIGKGYSFAGEILLKVSSVLENLFHRSKKNKMDMEIYEAISFLRNITILGRGSHYSADTVIELLVKRNGILAPYFGRMLQMLRQNQPGEAVAYFSEKVDTDIGRDFARLLIQWDAIEAHHLMEVLLSHQKNIREMRITAQKRRDETASDLIYLPVVVNIMVIFINFIYVGYYVDQRELLMLFY
ncbi:MAG: hypothetical protein ACOX4U_07415 [Anaerovoracaceae bacterium]|jgi:pilus assembly protein TadC